MASRRQPMTSSSDRRARRWNSTILASSTGEKIVLCGFRRTIAGRKWFHRSPLGDSLGCRSYEHRARVLSLDVWSPLERSASLWYRNDKPLL
jgi:hypothetical protein